MKHLIDVGEGRSVKVAVAVRVKAIFEATLRHFEHNVLDGLEFTLDLFVIFWQGGQSGENSKCFLFAALVHEPFYIISSCSSTDTCVMVLTNAAIPATLVSRLRIGDLAGV